MAKIKMLHGFEMWGKLILLSNGLSILKDKADWLINFTLLNY